MALKAYKHLTDGEVKIVEADSAEETSLLADVVHGASYLQLTSEGHSQEVAAAQGTALWEDVTSDLGTGGGGSSAEVFEFTNITIPAGGSIEAGTFTLTAGLYAPIAIQADFVGFTLGLAFTPDIGPFLAGGFAPVDLSDTSPYVVLASGYIPEDQEFTLEVSDPNVDGGMSVTSFQIAAQKLITVG